VAAFQAKPGFSLRTGFLRWSKLCDGRLAGAVRIASAIRSSPIETVNCDLKNRSRRRNRLMGELSNGATVNDSATAVAI